MDSRAQQGTGPFTQGYATLRASYRRAARGLHRRLSRRRVDPARRGRNLTRISVGPAQSSPGFAWRSDRHCRHVRALPEGGQSGGVLEQSQGRTRLRQRDTPVALGHPPVPGRRTPDTRQDLLQLAGSVAGHRLFRPAVFQHLAGRSAGHGSATAAAAARELSRVRGCRLQPAASQREEVRRLPGDHGQRVRLPAGARPSQSERHDGQQRCHCRRANLIPSQFEGPSHLAGYRLLVVARRRAPGLSGIAGRGDRHGAGRRSDAVFGARVVHRYVRVGNALLGRTVQGVRQRSQRLRPRGGRGHSRAEAAT